MLKRSIGAIDCRFYSEFGDKWDNKIFSDEIRKNINGDTVLLDIGAGRGIDPYLNFRGVVRKVYGIDPVSDVLKNPFLDEAFVGYGDAMKMFEDNQFDLVICCNVLEHLKNPMPFFLEINRVLKKGGLLITKTPNKYHYVPFIAGITPHVFHKFINKFRGRDEQDTFPTYYHINSFVSQSRIAKKTGFKVVEINYHEGRPEYLRINFVTYICGLIYERLVNLLHLHIFKVVMISKFRKTA